MLFRSRIHHQQCALALPVDPNKLLTGVVVTPAPSGVKLFGLFLVAAGSYGGLPSVVTWLGNNLAGQTKRGVGMAFQIGIGNVGPLSLPLFAPIDRPNAARRNRLVQHLSQQRLSALLPRPCVSLPLSPRALLTPFADGVNLGLLVLGLIASPMYAFLLKRANARKTAEQAVEDSLPEAEKRVYSIQELRDLGDRSVLRFFCRGEVADEGCRQREFVYTI